MQSSPDTRIEIRASKARWELRQGQNSLNWFLWASELAYSALLSGQLASAPYGASVDKLFADIPARAWYPSRTGRPHYYLRKAGHLRRDLKEATARIAGAVLSSWLSEFECFLKEVFSQKGNWGPYAKIIPKALGDSSHAVPLDDLLNTDVWRVVRNEIVHEPGQSRGKLDDEAARHRMVDKLKSSLDKDFRSIWSLSSSEVEERAMMAVANTLCNAQITARSTNAPVELLCCVFAFTSVDTLGHMIDKATLPAEEGDEEKTIMIRAGLLKPPDVSGN